MKWKGIKSGWKRLWGKTLDELILGNRPVYKELVGISWLNVHRFYDFRGWRFIRFKFFVWRKNIRMISRKDLSATE
jgi:hypothetical protein